MSGSVKTDPLFKGLTRPALIFGVSYGFAIVNIMLSTLSFMYTEDFRILFFLAPAVHGVGFYATSKEPLFMELIGVKLQKFNRCINRFYHGANSYDIV